MASLVLATNGQTPQFTRRTSEGERYQISFGIYDIFLTPDEIEEIGKQIAALTATDDANGDVPASVLEEEQAVI